MLYKENWHETKIKWKNYWKQNNSGTPLMCIVARNPKTEEGYLKAKQLGAKGYEHCCQGTDYFLPKELEYSNMEDKYQNAEKMVARYRHFCANHVFLAESFPNINPDFGPGSMAGYLGSEIIFNEDTVWFEHFVKDWQSIPPLVFNAQNKWWEKHLQLVKDIKALAGEDFYIGIPDIMENIDVLASLRGSQDLIFDLMDEEDEIKKRIEEVSNAYFSYYDKFYDIVKNTADNGSCYTVFQIWGEGKTAKLQCDFAAMLSPQHFRDFVQQPLQAQAKQLDTILYHLDGKECIRHMDAIMEIKEINALQFTSGDYGPDGTLEDWYVIYDKAIKAGKSLWVKVYSGEFEDWLLNADRIVKRYGSHSLFLHFPEMSMAQGEKLMDFARKNWQDIEGEVK